MYVCMQVHVLMNGCMYVLYICIFSAVMKSLPPRNSLCFQNGRDVLRLIPNIVFLVTHDFSSYDSAHQPLNADAHSLPQSSDEHLITVAL